jgi:uncharacterized protein
MNEEEPKTSRRGFGGMTPERRSEIGRLGGKAAHAKGSAHEFTADEAKAAGQKGGAAKARKRREAALMAIAVLIVLAIAGGACSGCSHNPTPAPTQPTNVTDAAPPPYSPPDGPATCLDVCRNGQHLGCDWANNTSGGATCTDVCANAQSAPGIPPWDLDCRARATSCAAVDRCP